jgi:hypothetical protein
MFAGASALLPAYGINNYLMAVIATDVHNCKRVAAQQSNNMTKDDL